MAGGKVRGFGSGWSRELRGAAANAWWTHALAPELEVAGGDSCLDKNALLWLWAAAYRRWPEAIKAWTKATATERGVSARSSRWRAEDWARASASVAKAVGGKAMEWMHNSISTRRMAQVMGA